MVWDNTEEKLYGPFMLKNNETKQKMPSGVTFSKGNMVGVAKELPIENTLDGHQFIIAGSGMELYLYFRGEADKDYCVSGFEKKELTFEEV